MKAVRIAELKSHLSHHLREVRAGRMLTVLDRDTPIARLIPATAGDDIAITVPGAKRRSLAAVRLPRVRVRSDVVAILLEDRRRQG